MNTLKLKKDFHNLIDSIENENLLYIFYELLKKRVVSQEGSLWNELTEKERQELNSAFEESENPQNLISHNTMRQKHKKWL